MAVAAHALPLVFLFLSLTASGSSAAAESNNEPVSVDFYLMSRCPDAAYCISALDPVMKLLDKYITISTHYIGFPGEQAGGWTCKHGPEECEGNKQQLCVQKYTRERLRYDWLYQFIQCNNKHGLESVGSFKTALTCLKEAKIGLTPAARMLYCLSTKEGKELLDADFAVTAMAGIKTSCTIQVEGLTLAVRDGGKWKDCPAGSTQEDFISSLCQAYAAKNRGRLPLPCKEQ